MRTLTAEQDNAVFSSNSSTHLRVFFDRSGAGTDFVNLSFLYGYDWIDSVQIMDSVEAAMATATIRVWRQAGSNNLSPFVSGSLANKDGVIVDIARQVYIEVATVGEDVKPRESDWVEIFRGEIDDLDWGKTLMVLKCRDQAGLLQDTFIETQAIYPDTLGTDLEDVIQEIIDDTVNTPLGLSINLYSINGTGAPAFNPSDSPGFVIAASFYQSKTTVYKAIRTLALLIGWDLRYRWQEVTGAFQLVLFDPQRSKSTPDFTLDADRYNDVRTLRISRENIRNKISIVYFTPGTIDRTQVIREDLASQAKYGLRYMEIVEASTSQIDSTPEAQALGDAAVSDLAEPTAQLAEEMAFFWPAELTDLARFSANGQHFDVDQDLAVVSLMHNLKGGANGKSSTAMTTRGTPSSGAKRWLEVQGLPGVGPPQDLRIDAAADNLAAGLSTIIGGLVVTFDDPRTMEPPVDDWAYTECHVSTSSGFTPAPGTLKAKGKQTRFEIGDLPVGVEHFVKVIHIDNKGNVGATSVQVSETTAKSSAFHENSDTIRDNLIGNGDFSQATLDIASNPPAGWEMATGTWVTDIDEDTTIHETGARSILLKTGQAGTLRSDFVPVSQDILYRLAYNLRVSAAPGASDLARELRFYDEDKAFISETNFFTASFAALNEFELRETYLYITASETTARFMTFGIAKNAAAFNAYCDRIMFAQAQASFMSYRVAGLSGIVTGTPTSFAPDTEDFDIGGITIGGTIYGFDPATGVYTVLEPGQYSFECRAGIQTMADGDSMRVGFFVDGAEHKAGAQVIAGGAGANYSTLGMTVDLAKDQTVEAYIWHNSGVNKSLAPGGAITVWFSGARDE